MKSEKIQKYEVALEIAKGLNISDSNAYLLKNPLKLTPDILKLVVNQCHFNDVLPKKIPTWAKKIGLVAPPKLSIEQCSSEFTSKIKAKYFHGKIGVDLTAGLGVDTFFLSQNFEHFTHNEMNDELSEIVKYNFTKLGISNVKFTQYAAEEFPFLEKVDFIYLDPARRNEQNSKLVKIQDCSPNLLEIKEKILNISKILMVKYSPMLDIKAAFSLLKHCQQVLVIAEKNEVKELVFILMNSLCEDPAITAINLNSEGRIQEFSFKYSEEEQIFSDYSEPKRYIFEPNAAILKSGGFKSVEAKFKVNKLAPNSHLYTSDVKTENLPGRMFEVVAVENYDKKILNKILPEKKANVACRNFPYNPDKIKKDLGWKDGGDKYVFFTENQKKKKIVLICNKIY